MLFFAIHVNSAGTARPTSPFRLPVITAINLFASSNWRLENYPFKPNVSWLKNDDFVLSL